MALQAGLVGLPNVGKSTLFNALTKSSVPAENFPFCTLDPSTAMAKVPDERLDRLMVVYGSQKLIPATMNFVDIAGLVKGASKGEGLGNQFLSHIMEVDLVIHVLRCFEDGNVLHVHNAVDPVNDFENILTELMLKDLESLEKRNERFVTLLKAAKNKQASVFEIKKIEKEQELVGQLIPLLEKGDHQAIIKLVAQAKKEDTPLIPLLSGKPFLVVANLSEEDFSGTNYKQNKHYQAVVARFGEENVVPVSAKIESELAHMDEADAKEFMQDLGIEQSGLDSVIKTTYQRLGLISFYTCGPKEAHAWTITQGTLVPQAAGVIHSDLERGFIAAEVYNCEDIFAQGSEAKLRTLGLLRTEGKTYVVKNGDILNIKFNV